MILPFAEWRARYTTYLKQRGMYRQGTTFRMDREQRPCVTSRNSQYQHSSAGPFHPGKRIRWPAQAREGCVEPAAHGRPHQPLALQRHPEFPSHPTTVVTKDGQGLHTVLSDDLRGRHEPHAIAVADVFLGVPVRIDSAKQRRLAFVRILTAILLGQHRHLAGDICPRAVAGGVIS
jgi:hypothetical protein